jgi:hypothetical protein
MLVENLPQCPICNQHSYRSGGAHIGGGSMQQWFTCEVCDISVLLMSESAAGYLIYTSREYTETANERQERERDGNGRPAPIEWLNGSVAVTLRDWAERREAKKHQMWLEFLPGFLERHNVQEYKPGCIVYHDLPTQEAKDEIDKRHETDGKVPGFLDSPPLPKIPSGVVVLQHTQTGWVRQDHGSSWDLEVPPDPITVRNAAFWNDVFEKVEITGATEIPNGYLRHAPNEPWFKFEVGSFTFEVGWRKRVVSITATSPEKQDFSAIHELAKRDDVTFEIDAIYGTKHQSQPVRGKSVLIHAWGRDKCVEYLNALLMVARAT